MAYTVKWYRYPHGSESEPMQSQRKEFNSLDRAVAFVRRKSDQIRGIYWAGAHVEDETGNYIFSISADGYEETWHKQ